MICKQCGSECADGNSFCENCGAKLNEVPVSAAAPAAQAAPAAPAAPAGNAGQAASAAPAEQAAPAAPAAPAGNAGQTASAAPQTPVTPVPPVNAYRPGVALDDGKSFGYAFLCFLFPIIGLILYLVWREQYPLRASSCGKGAIVGAVVSVAASIFYVVILVILAGAAGAGPYYYGALTLAACL